MGRKVKNGGKKGNLHKHLLIFIEYKLRRLSHRSCTYLPMKVLQHYVLELFCNLIVLCISYLLLDS